METVKLPDAQVLSVKHRQGVRGPFVGVTVVTMDQAGVLYWFRRTPAEQQAEPIVEGQACMVVGIVDGQSRDGGLTFLRDVYYSQAALDNDAAMLGYEEWQARRENDLARFCRERGIHSPAAQPAAPTGNGHQPYQLQADGAAVPDGTYTVVFGSDLDYETLQVETKAKGKLAGKTLVKYLAGPDNTTDFEAFGFLVGGYVKVWRRHLPASRKVQRCSDAVGIIARTGDKQQYGLAYAMRAGRCCRCNRKLTVPASLHRGMGPECAAREEAS